MKHNNAPLVILLCGLCLAACAQDQPTAGPFNANPANNTFQNPPPETATMVTIGWTTSPSTNIVSQTVSWGLSPTNYTSHMNLAPSVSRFQITGLVPATSYYIAILCTQSVGTSGTNLVKSFYSNEIHWTTNPTTRPVSPSSAAVISAP
jgi:hypothetical protein